MPSGPTVRSTAPKPAIAQFPHRSSHWRSPAASSYTGRVIERARALLFFDDQYLDRRENLERRVGRPTRIEEGSFRDPLLDPTWGYPSVFRDPESGTWHCLYEGQLPQSYVPEGRKHQHIAVVLESDDGISWHNPDLTARVPLPERVCPNQVLPLAGFGGWGPCFYDHHTSNPAERLKAFVSFHDADEHSAPLFVSADGLAWQRASGRSWHPTGIDPAVSAVWNPLRQSYVIAARPAFGDRRIAVYETEDWLTFTAPELAVHPASDDSPAAQVYGMPIFPYAQLFVGLLWIYHTSPVVAGAKYIDGKVDCRLAYSYNGWHFQRCLDTQFLPHAAPGEPGYGAIYPSSMVSLDDGTIRIYSSASESEHAQLLSEPELGQGSLLLHELRRDGFVYLEPPGGPGSLTTRRLYLRGAEVAINVQAPHGVVRAQVTDGSNQPLAGYSFDECVPFTGDDTAWQPRWREGRTVAALQGQVIHLELELFNGRLFALRGDLLSVTSVEYRRWLATGEQPTAMLEA